MAGVQTYKKGKVTRLHELNHQIRDDLTDVAEGPPLVYTPGGLEGSSRGRTFVIGTFECTDCSSSWHSGHISVEIFFASTLSAGNQRFDVAVWNQKCRVCKAVAVPDLETDTYVERVAFKLQLYLGRRDPVIPSNDTQHTNVTPAANSTRTRHADCAAKWNSAITRDVGPGSHASLSHEE